MKDLFDVSWMDETVENVPGKQGVYRLFCTLLFKRRMTYSNLYVIAYALNKHKFKDNELLMKETILKELALIYYYNNNKLPNGFEHTEFEDV
jgi:hypothetical protein